MAHSIPESHALAIHTSAGTVLHTGDWKIDPTPIIGVPTDERRLRELGDAGVLALIGDSTNAVREGRSPSETEVAKTITELVKAAKGRVAVTTFASNVARLRAVADAARAAGREVVVVGRAMERVVQVARETGHLDGVQNFRGADLYGHFPPDKVLALCTGSQGEPRAALSRIANDDHPQVTLNKGDCVIFSSRTIPGNEKAVGAIINGLINAGHRGHHRPHPPRPCLRPSAPRRTARHDLLGAAAAADPGSWRGAASVRARQAGARRRRAQGAGLPQRRSGQARTGRSRCDRAIAVGAAVQGRLDPGGVRSRARWSSGAGWPLPAAPSSAIAVTDKGELADDPEVDLVGIPEKNTAGEVIDDIVFDVVVSTVEGLPRARRRDPDAHGGVGAPRGARQRSTSIGARSRCATFTF